MPPWLYIWIARYLGGERFRKATPEEYRYFSGMFVFIPVVGALCVWFFPSDKASAIAIWLFATALGVFLIFGCFLWARFIPAKVSWILGGIIWLVAFVMALLGKL